MEKACDEASQTASDAQWRRVQDKAALEEAERLALALESWTRERRSELRQYDQLMSVSALTLVRIRVRVSSPSPSPSP